MTNPGLAEDDILSLVYDYLGVEGGYLRGFSYRSHEEFYPRYCGVRFDVAKARQSHGTTKDTFVALLREADPRIQASIVEGTFAAFPLTTLPEDRREKAQTTQDRLVRAVARLRGQAVQVDDLAHSNETVGKALADADLLIREQGNTSGVDRVHTALHGYLRALCAKHGLTPTADDDIAKLLRQLRQGVPAFSPGRIKQEEIGRLHGGLGTIVDALNPLRNGASLAHPNELLLDVAEAALAIDAARTILNYVNRKLG